MRPGLKPKLIFAGLALVLLALAIPQFADAVVWQMTGDTPDQLGAASPQSDARLARNVALLEGVDSWLGDPRARIRAGVLRLRLAAKQTDSADAAGQRNRGIADLRDGLGRMPASSIGWTALAQAELGAGAPAKAKAALTTSLLIDDHNPELGLWRCALGLALWNRLDGDDRRLWNDQVRAAWDFDPASLIALARQNRGAFAGPIRLALLVDPAHLAAFDRALAHP